MKLETVRLIIRPISLEDKNEIFQYRCDKETNKYQSWIPKTLNDVNEFISKNPNEFNIPETWFQLVIIDKATDTIIGDVGIHFIDNYQSEIGCTLFANNSDKGDWIPPEVLRAKFDPMKPYNGIFELGTLSEFKSKVNEGLQYNQNVIEEKNKIENIIQRQQELITSSKNSLLTSNEIYSFLVNTLITIGLLLYPVRLSILLFLWALKTVKQKQ